MSGIYIARTKPNRFAAVSLSGYKIMMTGEKKLHYPHFYGGSRRDADFSCPIITELQNFVVTLRMATLYKILILCVGFALSTNLWTQSLSFLFCQKGGKP